MTTTIFSRMMRSGQITHLDQKLRAEVWANGHIVDNKTLARYAGGCLKMKLDNHFLICGNNGTGKSWTGENLAEEVLPYGFTGGKETIFSDVSTHQFAAKLCKHQRRVFMADEIKKYLHHMRWNSWPQRNFMDSVEMARENGNMIIGCTREPDKIDFNYRDGKVNTVIFLVDRDENDVPFGFVLHSWVYMEQPDKFKFEQMQTAYTLPFLLDQVEENPMFLGYYFAEKEIKFKADGYQKLKQKAIKRLGEVMEDYAVRDEMEKGDD